MQESIVASFLVFGFVEYCQQNVLTYLVLMDSAK